MGNYRFILGSLLVLSIVFILSFISAGGGGGTISVSVIKPDSVLLDDMGCFLEFAVAAEGSTIPEFCKVSFNNWQTNYSLNMYNNTYFNSTLTLNLENGPFIAQFWCQNGSFINNTVNYTNSLSNLNVLPCANRVYDCSTLDTAGRFYYLQNNLSTTGTCLTISADNITLNLNGFNITGDSSGVDYGVYANGRKNITILNGSVSNFGTLGQAAAGIYFSSVNNSFIRDIKAIDVMRGVMLDSFSSYNIINNVSAISEGSIYYAGLILTSSNYNNLTNISSSGFAYGLSLDSVSNILVSNINTSLNRFFGIGFSSSSVNNLFNVTAIGNLDTGVYFSGSNSNFLQDIVIADSGSGGAVNFVSSSSNNILLNLNAYSNTGDLDISGNSVGGNNLIYNNTYGEIRFNSLSATSGDLRFGAGRNIQIGNNSAFVNSSALSSLNIPANVTLIGLRTDYTLPKILKDGVECTDCYNFTSLNAGTVVFNVTSWSNYSIVETFAGGSGTLEDPYQITTWTHLNNMRNYLDSYFILNSTLSTSSLGYTGLGDSWVPIGTEDTPFTGNFNGNGKNLSNLSVALSPNGADLGLFGVITGNINNVSLFIDGVSGNYAPGGSQRVGGLVGYNNGGILRDNLVKIYGTISGALYVGGVVGRNSGQVINSSAIVYGTVRGQDVVGGLVGFNFAGTLINSSLIILNNAVISSYSGAGLVIGTEAGSVVDSYGTIISSQYGNLTFLGYDVFTSAGLNLLDHINITNNSVYVDAINQAGLNKSANITFYGNNYQGQYPLRFLKIMKDGVACNDSLGCNNFTALTASTVSLNVSDFGAGNITLGKFVRSTTEISLKNGWNTVSLVLQNNDSSSSRNISVIAGWNFIGYSSNTPLYYNNLTFTNSSGTHYSSWNAAALAGKVQRQMVYSPPSSSRRTYNYVPLDDSYLRNGTGYWVKAYESGNITLPGVIGSYTDEGYLWSDLIFRNSTGSELNVSNAFNANWFDASNLQTIFYFWNITEGAYQNIPLNRESGLIGSWEGITLFTNKNNITMLRQD